MCLMSFHSLIGHVVWGFCAIPLVVVVVSFWFVSFSSLKAKLDLKVWGSALVVSLLTFMCMAVIFVLVLQFGFVLLLGLFYFFVVTFSFVSFSSLKAKLDLKVWGSALVVSFQTFICMSVIFRFCFPIWFCSVVGVVLFFRLMSLCSVWFQFVCVLVFFAVFFSLVLCLLTFILCMVVILQFFFGW